jgi:hypothetical protein
MAIAPRFDQGLLPDGDSLVIKWVAPGQPALGLARMDWRASGRMPPAFFDVYF